MVPDVSSRASRLKEGMGIRKGAWTAGPLLGAAALHHYRTRSVGEQRGTTVQTVGPRRSEGRTFAQLRARTVHERSQLPKLMACGLPLVRAAALGRRSRPNGRPLQQLGHKQPRKATSGEQSRAGLRR